MLYKIDEFLFDANEKILTSPDGEQVQVREQIAKILLTLLSAKGELVSFKTLEFAVWEDNLVSDATVKAEITSLRKLFGALGTKYIKNVRAKGYFLNAEITLVEELNVGAEIEKDTSTRKYSLLLITAAIAFLCIIVTSWVFMVESNVDMNHDVVVTPQITPLTSIHGVELDPSLSPSQRYLAFNHQVSNKLLYKVKVKDLSNGRIVEFNDSSYSAGATWANNDKSIYYATYEEGQCSVVRRTHSGSLNFSEPTTVASCGTLLTSRKVALDSKNQWLYFIAQQDVPDPFIIKRKNLETGLEQVLTASINRESGDYSFALSPDDKYLAILSVGTNVNSHLRLLNLSNGNSTELFKLGYLLYGVEWDKDSEHIYYINEKEVRRINIHSGMVNARFVLPNEAQTLEFVDDGKLLLSLGKTRKHQLSMISRLQLDYSKQVFEMSSFDDRQAAAISLDANEFVFISNRRGTNQIWYAKGDDRIQLTQFTGNKKLYIEDISPNKERVILSVNGSLLMLNVDTSQLSKIENNGLAITNALWMCNDNANFLATAKINDVWNLVKVTLGDEVRIHPIMQGVVTVGKDCSTNNYYVSKEGESDIYRLSTDMTSSSPHFSLNNHYYFSENNEWTVYKDQLYYVLSGAVYKLNAQDDEAGELPIVGGYMSTIVREGDSLLLTERSIKDNHIAELTFDFNKFK